MHGLLQLDRWIARPSIPLEPINESRFLNRDTPTVGRLWGFQTYQIFFLNVYLQKSNVQYQKPPVLQKINENILFCSK